MTNEQAVARILSAHPQFPDSYKGCDDWKCGSPADECRGIVTALTPTVDVIKRAISIGANLHR